MALNPRRRRHRRRYHRNPAAAGVVGSVMHTVKNPVRTVMQGATTAVSAYLTIAIPNQFLPFPGVDITSKVLRFLTRVASGGLVYGVARRFAPQYAGAILAGAALGSAGAFALDLLDRRIIVGSGDTGQTPLALLPFATGVGAYARLPRVGAYTRQIVQPARLGGPAVFPHRLYAA